MSKSLVLRLCRADMTSYGGFTWPSQGHVEAPDWEPTEDCGKGLHGWLNAEGDYTSSSFHAYIEAKYLVLEVETAKIIDLSGKCKFPSAEVLFAGGMVEALTLIEKLRPELKSKPLLFATRTAGKYGTATAGYKGTAIAGDFGTATAGDRGTATAGYNGTATAGERGNATAGYIGTAIAGEYGTATAGKDGTATAGDRGTATAGDRGTATAGDRGTATAGKYGTATAGKYGTATAGNEGTAIAGRYGTATAGKYGTAIAGDRGTATAGKDGTIQILYSLNNHKRVKMGYIGEEGLMPNVAYMLDSQFNFIIKEEAK